MSWITIVSESRWNRVPVGVAEGTENRRYATIINGLNANLRNNYTADVATIVTLLAPAAIQIASTARIVVSYYASSRPVVHQLLLYRYETYPLWIPLPILICNHIFIDMPDDLVRHAPQSHLWLCEVYGCVV